ncbi:MAG: sodium:glucose symporter, partial [Verrucomicrobiota bacterium]
MSISIIDAAIIVIYLIGITAVGCLCSRQQQKNANDYFLASRSLRWSTIGLALFATNISTVHLIGLASSGFSDGMVIGNFEWLAPFLLI